MIVCATGASINDLDWAHLRQFPKIGINQFFRKGIPTEYYYIYDKMCLIRENPNFTSALNKWPDTTFYIDKSIQLPKQFRKNTNIIRTTAHSVEIAERDDPELWAQSLEDPLYIGKSTITGAINLADILGATEIYIAGMDGRGGYFYPHKKNRIKHRLHDSLIHYQKYGTITPVLKNIKKWLEAKNKKMYSLSPKTFFTERKILEYKSL